MKVSPINVSTASKAQNSQYLFMGQLEELKVPTSGGTAEQSKQLKQLVDKWGCENEPIITSLRNTFGTSGSGAERLEHVVANFILPMQQQREQTSTQIGRGRTVRLRQALASRNGNGLPL